MNRYYISNDMPEMRYTIWRKMDDGQIVMMATNLTESRGYRLAWKMEDAGFNIFLCGEQPYKPEAMMKVWWAW